MDELFSVIPTTDDAVILAAINADPNAAEELALIVYDELRRLAASRRALESLGRMQQPTGDSVMTFKLIY